MTNNVTADAGSGGETFATDDVGGVQYPIGKIAFGADDSATWASSGNGTTDAGTQRVTISSDSTGTVALSATDNAVLDNIDTNTTGLAGTVSGSELQVDVVAALPVGANTIGVVDLGATDNAVLDSIVTNTNAAASHYRNIDANAEAEIKGSAGTLYWLHAMNMTAAVAYVHLYDNVAASVTPGTTTPDSTFPIATQGDTNGAGFTLNLGANGQAFGTGITIVVTTTLDGAAGDPGTNGVIVNAGYT